ncbi:MAG TPA: Gfo/Idh/MocA family oxidoreductase [Bryobacteraceae bacterium]|nr:Gfo/Idh/MocA family oxidoreductase [Bryobacteraceae bacterium]
MKEDRRRFLAGGAAMLASARMKAQAEKELRTAMIGIGSRGGGLLKQVLAQQNVKVAAVCDIDPQARDNAQTAAGRDNPRAYTDYRQVLDLKDVDAVVIATPCDLHAEMSAAALEAGKYVYCEKPLGITPEQVKRALDASRRAKTFLQIGQQLRYFPGMREAVRLIQEEKILGAPFVIKAQRHSTPVPLEAQQKRPAWYKDVRRSGDLIVENAVHNLDVCNWITGSRPTSAYGHGKKYLPEQKPAGTEMMDGFSVEYIYDNDMHLDYSQLYLHPRTLKTLPNYQWYLVFGEKGTLDFTQGLFYDIQGTAEPREVVPQRIRERRENAMSEFYACIREGRKPVAGVEVGATAALTVIMGREAIYRRRMVTWKELGVEV